jgi:uncharacterized membrane protein YhaH (DUF805 family)
MFEAIKHGLGNLLNFNGRDARQAFWYYVLFVYLITLAISAIVAVPMVLQGVMSGIQQGMAAGQSGDPVAAQATTETAINRTMTDTMVSMMWVGSATNLLMLLALAASFVRRLHDSDLTGWWALIPGAIMALIGSAILFGGAALQALEYLQYVWPLGLIVAGLYFLLRRTTPQPTPQE